tara:strand:+ start:1185 stop:2282 length:1098 start_codon:yes stop_codon:yes gene_type:complete
MKQKKLYKVIGIMTGTSMDGIDISYVSTDGLQRFKIIKEKNYQYSLNEQVTIKKANIKINEKKVIKDLDIKISNLIIKYLKKFFKDFNINKTKVNYLSVSGQTILHIPKKKISLQLGNPKIISNFFKINVISNFRTNDINHGGQGAPIGSFYHKFLIKKLNPNSVIINLGGVANFALIYKKKLISSDIGPANAISDDLMFYFFGKRFDNNGILASKGKIDNKIFNLYKNNTFFKKKFPKSLDRNNFYYLFDKLKKINPYNALNTSVFFTIFSILNLLDNKISSNINEIIFTGGGRKNKYLISTLRELRNNLKISLIDDYKLDGDLIESQMFAYIGVRSQKKLTLSTPLTTGVKKYLSGGNLFKFN